MKRLIAHVILLSFCSALSYAGNESQSTAQITPSLREFIETQPDSTRIIYVMMKSSETVRELRLRREDIPKQEYVDMSYRERSSVAENSASVRQRKEILSEFGDFYSGEAEYQIRGHKGRFSDIYYLYLNAFKMKAKREGILGIAQLGFVERIIDGEERNDFPETPASKSPPSKAAWDWESLTSNNWGYRDVGYDTLHDLGYQGFGKMISIIDRGIDDDHPAVSNFWNGSDDFEFGKLNVVGAFYYWVDGDAIDELLGGHGTMDAGVVWQCARDADFVICEIPGMTPFFRTSNMIDAIEWSHDIGADVITTSMGKAFQLWPSDGTSSLCLAFQKAVDINTTVVAAAGNSVQFIYYPAQPSSADSVLSVSSYNASHEIDRDCSPKNSHRGKPDIAAPGVNIRTLCLVKDGSVTSVDGSSVAAPHVAGLALILRQIENNARIVEQAILNSAIPIPDSDGLDGRGRINAVGAYNLLTHGAVNAEFVASPTEGTTPLTVAFDDFSTPIGEITEWEWDFNSDGVIDSYQQEPTYEYTQPGTYTVSLTVSDGVKEDIEVKANHITVNTPSSPYPPTISFLAPKNEIAHEWCLIQWTDSDPDDNAWIYFYYDTDASGYDGTCFNTGNPIFEDGEVDQYTWDTRAIPEGKYWVYAIIDDGTSQNQDYSPGWVEVHHPVLADNFSVDTVLIETQDGDPYPESGEMIDMEVVILNDSHVDSFYYVKATLSTYESEIDVLDDYTYYGNFGPRDRKVTGEFEWESLSSYEGDSDFELLLEYEDERHIPYFEVLDIPIHVCCEGCCDADFEILNDQTLYFDHSPYGNGDGVLQSGEERVKYGLKLKNTGYGAAVDVEVEVVNTPPPGVYLRDRDVQYPDLQPDYSSYQIEGDTLAIDVPRGFWGPINLDLLVTYNYDKSMTTPFTLQVESAPWFKMTPERVNLGQRQPDLIDTSVVIGNQGTATLMIDAVQYSHLDITITDPSIPFSISDGQSQTVSVQFDAQNLDGFHGREIVFASNDHLEQEDTLTIFGTICSETDSLVLELVDQFSYEQGSPQLYGDPNAIEVGDFDGDDTNEIVISTNINMIGSDFIDGSGIVIFDYTDGAWSRVYYDTPDPVCSISEIKNLAVSDLDNDGLDEIVFCGRPNTNVTQNSVFIYDYNGTYYLANTLRTNSHYKVGLTVGDVDKDGNKEIIFFEKDTFKGTNAKPATQSNIFAYERTSGLNFSNVWTSPNLYEYGTADLVGFIAGLNVADSDDDGFNEILFLAADGQIFIFENFSSTPTFHYYNPTDRWDCRDYCDMKVSDTDNDGHSELLICSEDDHVFYIIETTGDDAYNTDTPVIFENVRRRNWITVGDMDGNGIKEIYLLGYGSSYREVWAYESFADNAYRLVYKSPIGFILDDVFRGEIADCIPNSGNSLELALATYDDDFIPIYGVMAPLPDLVIFDESLIIDGALEENSEILIKYDITNIGSTDLVDILVRVYDNPPDSTYANLLEEKAISQILGGQTWHDSTQWVPALADSYHVHVLVDPEGSIPEGNEDNNTASKQVSIADDDVVPPVISDVLYTEESGDGDGLWEDNEAYRIAWNLYDNSGISSAICFVGSDTLNVIGGYPDYYCIAESLIAGEHVVAIEATDNDNSPLQSTHLDTIETIQHAPLVLSVYPPDQAEDVSPEVIITATFDTEIIPESVNKNTFLLHRNEIQQDALIIEYNAIEKTAYFHPSSHLGPESQYVVTLKGLSDTRKSFVHITDINGNSLENDVKWSFTTELAPEFSVDPDSIFFGNVIVGSSDTEQFTIANHGAGSLSGVITSPAPYIVTEGTGGKVLQKKYGRGLLPSGISPWNIRAELSGRQVSSKNNAKTALPYGIESGDSITYDLTFEPSSVGNHDDSVLITSNDPSSPISNIAVFGSGVLEESIIVTWPNGGQNIQAGDSVGIVWDWQGPLSYVRIELSGDAGQSWEEICCDTCFVNAGSVSWLVPNKPSSNCFMRISDCDDGVPSDTSDAPFVILPMTVNITAPDSTSEWMVDSTYHITWDRNVGTYLPWDFDLMVEYSYDNGSNWLDVDSTRITDDSVTWVIPPTPSGSCFVRGIVVPPAWAEGDSVADTSERFSIRREGTYVPPGDVSGTWIQANSPYIILGDIRVPPDSSLTIEPGVTVKFDDTLSLDVEGELMARGIKGDIILFTSNNVSPQRGDWGSIKFTDSSVDAVFDAGNYYVSGCIVEYCRIEYGGDIPGEDHDGVIHCDHASPFIGHNTIAGNSGYWGGGIGCYFYSSPTITGNTITGDSAYHGGGICCDNNSSPTITGNTIAGNYSEGIYCNNRSAAMISDNYVNGNSSVGVYCGTYSSPSITNNTISMNSGRGIFCMFLSSPTVSGNTIIGNSGGISCVNRSSATITGNSITGNSASDGGGIYCFDESAPTITYNRITGNSASSDGGGIYYYNYYAIAEVSGNTVAGNHASSYGGGIFSSASTSLYITDNTIAGNSSASGGGGIYCLGSSSLTNNDIAGNSAPSGGGIYHQGFGKGRSSLPPANIAGNDICGNSASYGGGIYCCDASFTIINNNNLVNEGGYEVYLSDVTSDIDAANNWWGTTNTGSIDVRIYDYYDDITLGKVLYDPILTSPAVGGPDSVYSVVLKADDTYKDDLTTDLWIGATMYIQLEGTDSDRICVNQTTVTIISDSTDTLGIRVALTETDSVSGIFRGMALIDSVSVEDVSIGATVGETITITSDVDSTKFTTVLVVGEMFVAGMVAYCHTGGPVEDVTMTLSGDSSGAVNTDSSGHYKFLNLSSGLNYTVTPSKPEEGCPFFPIIIMYDAALTAQHVVMMIDLDSCGQWAADVDENGIIQMYDAALIAQCAVGIPNPECHAGEWRFDPESRSYTPLDSDQTNEDYIATLLGDVDGNWPPAAAGLTNQLASQSYRGLSDIEVGVEELVQIPLVMEQGDGVISADIVFSYDPRVLEFVGISKMVLSEEFQVVYNDEPGKLRAGLYGITPITEAGKLVVLSFKVVGEEDQTTTLSLERYQLNAGPVKSAEAKLTIARQIPKEYALSQNYPNPFNPETKIGYQLPEEGWVTLKVYNIEGQLVGTLVDRKQNAGYKVTTWDAGPLSSGIYFYRLKAGDFVQTRKMVVLK